MNDFMNPQTFGEWERACHDADGEIIIMVGWLHTVCGGFNSLPEVPADEKAVCASCRELVAPGKEIRPLYSLE